MSDEELLDKMKKYIGRKLDQDSDPNAMKAIISEYMHMKGDDYRWWPTAGKHQNKSKKIMVWQTKRGLLGERNVKHPLIGMQL